MTRFFLNTTQNLVPESLDGFLRTSLTPVARLSTSVPDINIIVRPDWTPSLADREVALISGGGSGHEPLHCGLVGPGLLTAAVCGGLFASPPVDAVLTAIQHVAGQAGVFVIIKAYTGDCLNFGLAVERARAQGLSVDAIIFSDDIALPDHPRPRGLAGTAVLEKILGFHASSGSPLAALKAVAESVMSRISTLGVSLSSCSLPDAAPVVRVDGGRAELGLGLHGEPGAAVLPTQNATDVVRAMTERLRAKRRGALAVLLNNLGGVSELEMGVIARALLTAPGLDVRVLIGPARVCTSLDMKGFSITFLEIGGTQFADALLAPVRVHGWVPAVEVHPPLELPARNQPAVSAFAPSRSDAAEAVVRAACEALRAAEARLNELDAAVGDGDTGRTFASGANAVLSEIARLPLADTAQLFRALSGIAGRAMGGSSGVLLAIMFIETARVLENGGALLAGLRAGVAKMATLGGAEVGWRTMLDALVPAVAALEIGVKEAAEAAEAGAESTRAMDVARAGRASYLRSETLIGNADPGAVAVAIVFRAIADQL